MDESCKPEPVITAMASGTAVGMEAVSQGGPSTQPNSGPEIYWFLAGPQRQEENQVDGHVYTLKITLGGFRG